jgi:hypothetical protein
MEVLIRYNTKSIGNEDKWRLLVEGKEFLCYHVQMSCQTETCMRPIFEDGKLVDKWHIRAFNFNEIIFQFGEKNKLIILLV